MSEPIRIRNDDGTLTEAGIELGRERMTAFAEGHGKLQAMTFFLIVSVTRSAAAQDYDDDQLRMILQDATDVRDAAEEWCSTIGRMVDEWRAQRDAGVPDDG